MITTIKTVIAVANNLPSFVWERYYRAKFGTDYADRLEGASRLSRSISDFSRGGAGHNYDMSGNQIRGVLKPKARPSVKQHPLIAKYSR
jgi:hypothetical protein